MQTVIDAIVREQTVNFLVPLVLQTANGDPERARQAVDSLLEPYNARTARELRLAALAIAFGFGALDALARSSDADATVSQVLRLRSNANALARSAEKAEQALQAERAEPVADQPAEIKLPGAVDIEALLNYAKTAPTLSRQQRRHAERLAQKHQRYQQNLLKQQQRTAQRMEAAS